MRGRAALLATVALAVPAGLGVYLFAPPRPWIGSRVGDLPTVAEPAEPSPAWQDVALHAMDELDFKPRDEIYDYRRARVEAHPDLLERLALRGYEPSNEVFGQIVGGLPWWGSLGLSYFGSGSRGIEGPSEESRFAGNPYLLVGVDQRVAYNFTETGKAPESLLPVPRSLTFDRTALRGASRYEVASHFEGVTTRLSTHERPDGITIVAYNARDLGLPFLAVDVTRSQAIRPVAPGVVKIPQYIHRGNSCGYAGGCNNMSPKSDAMDIDVERLPARIVVKLWRQEPTASSDPPNVWWTIDLE